MSRQRDYQPTIDRQRVQIADLKRQVGEQRAAAKDAHRDVSHLRYALQCANEEADNARLALLVQDSLVADLRADRDAALEKADALERLVVELSKPAEKPDGEPSWFRMFLGSVRRPSSPAKATAR